MADSQAVDIASLSLSERIILAQDLWDSIVRDAGTIPVLEWQREEIHRRLDRLNQGDADTRPWSDVLAEAKERLRQ